MIDTVLAVECEYFAISVRMAAFFSNEGSSSEGMSSQPTLFQPPCTEYSSTDELPAKLLAVLPGPTPEAPVHICEYTEKDGEDFTATLRLQISSCEEVKKWLDDFQKKSRVTLRVTRTHQSCGRINLYKVDMHCQHNKSRYKGQPSMKKCGCMTTLKATLRAACTGKSKNTDLHMPQWPFIVQLDWCHNHPVHAAVALRYRDVAVETKNQYLELFTQGLSPPTAIAKHQSMLMDKHGDNYKYVQSDRSFNPDYFWVYRLYRLNFENIFGRYTGPLDYDETVKRTSGWAEDAGIKTASAKVGTNLVIACVSPIMERVHRLVPQSGEVVFMDSSGSMDRYDTRVFLLLTNSPVGGLPLGLFFSTSEAQDCIQQGLQLILDILGSSAFHGRGQAGPSVWMTDMAVPERNAIRICFPTAELVLCIFHVLQAVWRKLWDSKSNVDKKDRPHVMNSLKALVYAKTPEQIEQLYEDLKEIRAVKENEGLKKYFSQLWDMREEWGLCFRKQKGLKTRGQNTNNLTEAAFRVLKDKVLNRERAYNPVHLFVSLATQLPEHYSNKILGKLSVQPPHHASVPEGWDITREGDHIFNVKVPSKPSYTVETTCGTCSCYVGMDGSNCKHQLAVMQAFGEACCFSIQALTSEEKLKYFEVATGCTETPAGWFDPWTPQAPYPSTSEPAQCTSIPTALEGSVDMDTDTAPARVTSEDVIDQGAMLLDMRAVFADIEKRISADPQTFSRAVPNFIRNYKSLSSNSRLSTALTVFGRTVGGRKQTIPVQPTAVARRKYTCGGKRARRSGRPPIGSSLETSEKSPSSSILPSQRRRRQPHSLSLCVKKNTSLGKSHSKK